MVHSTGRVGRSLLGSAPLLVGLACGNGGEANDDPMGGGGDPGTDGNDLERADLIVPLMPIEVQGFSPRVERVEDTADGQVLYLESDVALGVGDRYPAAVRGQLAETAYDFQGTAVPGCDMFVAVLSIESVTQAPGQSPAMTHDADGALHLSVAGPSESEVLIEGQVSELNATNAACDLRAAADGTRRFVWRMRVQAIEPSGLLLAQGGCRIAGTLFEGRVAALDAAAMSFSPFNAMSSRPLTVGVSTDADGETPELGPALGLGVWLPATALEASIFAARGDAARLEIQPASDVSDVEIAWVLPAIKLGHARLEPDGVYDQIPNEVVPYITPAVGTVQAGAEPACEAPFVRWFSIESHTPAICPVVDSPSVSDRFQDSDGTWSLSGQAVRLDAPGTCDVEIRAPALDGGRGISSRIRVSFTSLERAPLETQ